MTKEPIQLLELERELSGPNRETAMRRHDAVLAALDARLSAALLEGMAPGEYDRARILQEAVITARKLLRLTVRKGV